jgi:hypothetical protein
MAMTVVLSILVAIGLIGTLLSLFTGLFSMGRGGAFNQRYGNKLMRMRVYFHGLTIVAVILLVWHLRG